MKRPLLLILDDNRALGRALAAQLDLEVGQLCIRHFPDGESYLRLDSPCCDRDVLVLCSLQQPDNKLFSLCALADLLHEQGARQLGLIAPYLAYLRQDCRFQPGEAITSRTFARLLSGFFDWLLTIDPHLHRYHSLNDIYQLQGISLSASPAIAQWIHTHVSDPVLLGPDSESSLWIENLAQQLGCPYRVLEKVRLGDHQVELSLPDLDLLRQHTPVLVDDICSSGTTLLEVAEQLQLRDLPAPIAIIVHGLFAGRAWTRLQQSRLRRIVSCNGVPHESNAIDLGPLISEALRQQLKHSYS